MLARLFLSEEQRGAHAAHGAQARIPVDDMRMRYAHVLAPSRMPCCAARHNARGGSGRQGVMSGIAEKARREAARRRWQAAACAYDVCC